MAEEQKTIAPSADGEELLTLDEAVQFLGTSKPTLYRVLGQGDLKGLKVGRQWRFRKADLIAYMERSPVAVAAAPVLDLDEELAFFSGELRRFGAEVKPEPEVDTEASTSEDKTAQLAWQIAKLALRMLASDIHLEPISEGGINTLRIRYRIDGVLQEIRRLSVRIQEALIQQFKTMADMNLGEHRLSQDGRFPIRFDDIDFDLRVSLVPAVYGETIVIRILNKGTALIGLEKLGLSSDDLTQIRELLAQPNGLLIATGPTGAGKTTFLYSCLQDVSGIEKKTLTVEDPIEYVLANSTQIQVNKRIGMTFAAGVRSIMRQDPDIIMIGELRDLETTELVIEATLTGHLVLTTLHTNDAPLALVRLLDIGIEPYLVAATVVGVTAVRLCRKICENCKEAYQVPARDLIKFGLEPDDPDQTITLYRGRGCEHCRHRGYRGRIGLFELLTMTEDIGELIVGRAPVAEIAAAARAAGMNSLRQDGLLKVLDGLTTPEEVRRVVFTGGISLGD